MTHYVRYWRENDRDEYECPRCGDEEGPFEVHHRNGRGFDNRLSNLVALCRSCHRELHASGEAESVTSLESWMREFEEELIVE